MKNFIIWCVASAALLAVSMVYPVATFSIVFLGMICYFIKELAE